MSSRSSKVEPLEVQEILQSGGQISAKPSPVEHVATPPSPAPSVDSFERRSIHSHSRTMSVATDTTAARSNRFSMSFPVQPSGSMSPARTSHSPVREAPSVVPESLAALTGPTDTNFLTAIAAQERRVLELKEELTRAEADLNKLKRQWAQHEAQKKRNDAKNLTNLQPLQTSLSTPENEEDSDGSNAWMHREMERRKALLSGNKSSNRTVFSGSRHTRTLSLLSPASRGQQPAQAVEWPSGRPPRKESLSESARRSQEAEATKTMPPTISRAATTPDLTVDGTKAPDPLAELVEAGVDKDMLLQTGKKVATGLRDGLWTFWEDLRQATVGEDVAQIRPPPRRQSSNQTLRSARKQSSKSSLRPSSRGSSTSKTSTETKKPSPARKHTKSATMSLGSTPALADPSFWADHGILPPSNTTTPMKKSVSSPRTAKTLSQATSDLADDAWDNWDEPSPQGSRSSSAASESTTLPSTVSGATSPRMSTEWNDQQPRQSPSEPTTAKKDKKAVGSESTRKDPIPWPALSNLGPKALRRTASHLMSEWEKSLTPSPTKEHTERGDYLGLGAEAAAASVSGERKRD